MAQRAVVGAMGNGDVLGLVGASVDGCSGFCKSGGSGERKLRVRVGKKNEVVGHRK